jgi:Fe-S-cluster containining protein
VAEKKSLPLAPLPLEVENLETATFKCVFPVCGGICCKNGRPPVEPDEQAKIEKNLARFLPHLRESARAHIEKNGWLTNRVKDGHHTIAVEGGWCVFANEGCTFQKVGMLEGEPWRYKPSACIRFPLEKTKGGTWYIRQHGYRGEGWDLFCLNPEEDPTPASESMRDEIVFSAEREKAKAKKASKKPT